MVDRLDRLVTALREERAKPLAARGTGAEDGPLDGAIDKVDRARAALAEGERATAAALLAEVAHHAVDSWSYTSPLSTEVVDCSQALRGR